MNHLLRSAAKRCKLRARCARMCILVWIVTSPGPR
jgi:hypothetical protein